MSFTSFISISFTSFTPETGWDRNTNKTLINDVSWLDPADTLGSMKSDQTNAFKFESMIYRMNILTFHILSFLCKLYDWDQVCWFTPALWRHFTQEVLNRIFLLQRNILLNQPTPASPCSMLHASPAEDQQVNKFEQQVWTFLYFPSYFQQGLMFDCH